MSLSDLESLSISNQTVWIMVTVVIIVLIRVPAANIPSVLTGVTPMLALIASKARP